MDRTASSSDIAHTPRTPVVNGVVLTHMQHAEQAELEAMERAVQAQRAAMADPDRPGRLHRVAAHILHSIGDPQACAADVIACDPLSIWQKPGATPNATDSPLHSLHIMVDQRLGIVPTDLRHRAEQILHLVRMARQHVAAGVSERTGQMLEPDNGFTRGPTGAQRLAIWKRACAVARILDAPDDAMTSRLQPASS